MTNINQQTCYYCEESQSATEKFGQPICSDCNNHEIRTMQRFDPNETEEKKAWRLKHILGAFKFAFSEEDDDEENDDL